MVDVEQLKREWREKAAAHGVDRQDGATGYQVATIKAERAKAAHRQDPTRWWWQNHEMWLEHGYSRSITEEDALWHVYRAAYRILLNKLGLFLVQPYNRRCLRRRR
jgi:hypothetical protein